MAARSNLGSLWRAWRRVACSDAAHVTNRWLGSSPVREGKSKLAPSGAVSAPRVKMRHGQPRSDPGDPTPVATLPNIAPPPPPAPPVEVYDGITVAQLAERLGYTPEAVQGLLAGVGETVVSATQPVSMEAAELLALVRFLISSTVPFEHRIVMQASPAATLMPSGLWSGGRQGCQKSSTPGDPGRAGQCQGLASA